MLMTRPLLRRSAASRTPRGRHGSLALAILVTGPLLACGSSPTAATPSPSPSVIPVPVPTPTPSAVLPIAGAYRLSIGVDPSCAGQIPSGFLTQSYDVDIEAAGDHSAITFLSPDVTPLPASATEGSGSIDTGKLRLDFSFIDARASTFALAVTAGAGDLPVPSPGRTPVSGPLFADLRYTDASHSGQCTSPNNSFSLVPR